MPVQDSHGSQPQTPRSRNREEKQRDEKEKGRTPEKDRERERERERQREKDRHTDRGKEREREKERDREKERERDRQREKERERDRQRDKERQREKERERERERERSRGGDSSVSRRVGVSPVSRRRHEGSSREASVGVGSKRPAERGADVGAVQKRLRAEQREKVEAKSELLSRVCPHFVIHSRVTILLPFLISCSDSERIRSCYLLINA